MEDGIRTTFKEVELNSAREAWYGSMDDKMRSLERNETLKFSGFPKRKKAIDGSGLTQRKEKLIARYNIQLVWFPRVMHKKRDLIIMRYFLTFVRHFSIRILLELVAQYDP